MSSNAQLLTLAHKILPGGSLGSFYGPEGTEFVIRRAEGSRVYDVEDRVYIDYVLGSGPMILGHAHPEIVAAVQVQMERGSSYYALNEVAIRFAEKIISACPCAEAVKFCGSGSEATFYALRLARAATGRDKILKFEGGYHGHHDYAMISVWPTRSEAFPSGIADSAGIPVDVQHSVLVAPFNDLSTTLDIIEHYRQNLAAVIVEPINRLVEPRPGFLEGLRKATRASGIVLIFDEVVTGFRVSFGGAQELYGVTPDLACYGKILGGGLPIGAVVGKRDLIDLANPRKRGTPSYTYINGTLNGNPLSASAGLATLTVLERPGTYDRLRALGEKLRSDLREIVERLGIRAQVLGTGPMANMYFTAEPINDYRSYCKADSHIRDRLNRELLVRGVIPNLASKMYLSLAHTQADLEFTLKVFEESLQVVYNS